MEKQHIHIAKHPERIKQEAIEAFRSGMSVGEISKALSLPRATVRNWVGGERLLVKTEGKKVKKTKIFYSPETKQRAVKTLISGTSSYAEVAKSLGVPVGLLYNWVSQEKHKTPLTQTSQSEIPPVAVPQPSAPYRMSLEDFVSMLHSLVTDYERMRARLHELERLVEKWKVTAGSLNDQLNRANLG